MARYGTTRSPLLVLALYPLIRFERFQLQPDHQRQLGDLLPRKHISVPVTAVLPRYTKTDRQSQVCWEQKDTVQSEKINVPVGSQRLPIGG